MAQTAPSTLPLYEHQVFDFTLSTITLSKTWRTFCTLFSITDFDFRNNHRHIGAL